MNFFKLFGLAVALLILITACEKEETNPINLTIEGIYEGTLANLSGDIENKIAVSEIIITEENTIQLHCFAEGFDSTFMMNYYNQHDSVYVCYTGIDFNEMYGHQLGEGHSGCMMCNMQSGETEWGHHMSEEHNPGDMHFGGFDVTNHSFSFTFQMNRNDFSDDLYFHGVKK